MKKVIFVLCVVLVVLLVVWLVMRYNKFISSNEQYVASDADTEIVIYDIDDLEQRRLMSSPVPVLIIYMGVQKQNVQCRKIHLRLMKLKFIPVF